MARRIYCSRQRSPGSVPRLKRLSIRAADGIVRKSPRTPSAPKGLDRSLHLSLPVDLTRIFAARESSFRELFTRNLVLRCNEVDMRSYWKVGAAVFAVVTSGMVGTRALSARWVEMSPQAEAAWLGGQPCPGSQWVLSGDTDVIVGATIPCGAQGAPPSPATLCPPGVVQGQSCGITWCAGNQANLTCTGIQPMCGYLCVIQGVAPCPQTVASCDQYGLCSGRATNPNPNPACPGHFTYACEN